MKIGVAASSSSLVACLLAHVAIFALAGCGRSERHQRWQSHDAAVADSGPSDASPADGSQPDGSRPDGSPPDAGPSPDAGAAAYTWVRQNPLPHGCPLRAVWAASAGDVWAAGGGGALVRFGASARERFDIAGSPTLNALHGFAPDDVWAAGELGALLHWEGKAWTPHEGSTATIVDLWGSSPDDLWAVGDEILHFDGDDWSEASVPEAPPWVAIWGSARDNVWALTAAGIVLRYDGAWSVLAGPPFSADERAAGVDIGGAPGGDVFTLHRVERLNSFSSEARVSRWDGGLWSTLAAADSSASRLLPVSAADVWLVAAAAGRTGELHRSSAGSPFERIGLPPHGRAVVGLWTDAADELWAVGEAGSAARWDGTSFTELSQGASFEFYGLRAFGGQVLAYGGELDQSGRLASGLLERWDGERWLREEVPGSGFLGLWQAGRDDRWAVGVNEVWHGVGDGWVRVYEGSERFRDVWSASSGEVWLAGDDVLWRGDGATWQAFDVPGDFEVVRGSSPRDVWACGETADGLGIHVHWDGATWSEIAVPLAAAASISSLSVLSPASAWGGSGADVLRWDGTRWHVVWRAEMSGPQTVKSVVARSESDVWVLAGHTLAHFDGTEWALEAVPAWYDLRGLLPGESGELWVAGSHGELLMRALAD